MTEYYEHDQEEVVEEVLEEGEVDFLGEPIEKVEKPKKKSGPKKSGPKESTSKKAILSVVQAFLYKEPDDTGRFVKRIYKGTRLSVLSDNFNEDWLEVSFSKGENQVVGFIRASKVKRG